MLEVPEIESGVVEIKAIAREPGRRTKIAVWSTDDNVDPVGSCVGAGGARVREIMTELRGEKVDIVPFSEDPIAYVRAALSPAKNIQNVLCDYETGTATVIVPDDQLSLAIGKEGQNARLAARLTGWRIDIQAESGASAAAEEVEAPILDKADEFIKDETLQTSPVETVEEAEEEIAAEIEEEKTIVSE